MTAPLNHTYQHYPKGHPRRQQQGNRAEQRHLQSNNTPENRHNTNQQGSPNPRREEWRGRGKVTRNVTPGNLRGGCGESVTLIKLPAPSLHRSVCSPPGTGTKPKYLPKRRSGNPRLQAQDQPKPTTTNRAQTPDSKNTITPHASGVILDRVSFHGRFVHFHLPSFLPSFLPTPHALLGRAPNSTKQKREPPNNNGQTTALNRTEAADAQRRRANIR